MAKKYPERPLISQILIVLIPALLSFAGGYYLNSISSAEKARDRKFQVVEDYINLGAKMSETIKYMSTFSCELSKNRLSQQEQNAKTQLMQANIHETQKMIDLAVLNVERYFADPNSVQAAYRLSNAYGASLNEQALVLNKAAYGTPCSEDKRAQLLSQNYSAISIPLDNLVALLKTNINMNRVYFVDGR